MKKIQCEACGSNDIVKIDSTFFQCQFCGTKYTIDSIQAMLQGPVEITVGQSEMNRLIKNALTFNNIGGRVNREKAVELLEKITQDFPSYPEAWTTYIDANLDWNYRIKCLPNKDEATKLDNAVSALRSLPDSKDLAVSYNEKLRQFWQDAGEGLLNNDGWYIVSPTVKQLHQDDVVSLIFHWEYMLNCPAITQVIQEARELANSLNQANIVYDYKLHEWVDFRSDSFKEPLYVFNNMALLLENGIVSFQYCNETASLIIRANEIIEKRKQEEEAKREAAMIAAHPHTYCKHCHQNTGVKTLFSYKCRICGRKI